MAELAARSLGSRTPRAIPAATPSTPLPPPSTGCRLRHRLVIVVDQFEETFNATLRRAERSARPGPAHGRAAGPKVIVSMRADHYDKLRRLSRVLARLMGTDQVLVGPLTRAELAAVVEHPAQRAGPSRGASALTAALVEDAGDEPGVLPSSPPRCSSCGRRATVRARRSRPYRASGGLHGAIARLAESTWSA
ncbi:MAG: hypothetical protein U0869_04775 [Chloroflexota bacterium]